MKTFLLLALVAVTAFAAQPQTIQGRITDPAGAVIPNAHVLLINLQTLKTWDSQADQKGGFSFPDLSAGKYEIKVAYPAFLTYSKQIQLTESRPVTITVKMKFDPQTSVVY